MFEWSHNSFTRLLHSASLSPRCLCRVYTTRCCTNMELLINYECKTTDYRRLQYFTSATLTVVEWSSYNETKQNYNQFSLIFWHTIFVLKRAQSIIALKSEQIDRRFSVSSVVLHRAPHIKLYSHIIIIGHKLTIQPPPSTLCWRWHG